MKWIVPLCVALVFISCQKEELKITDDPVETSILDDQELTSLVRSVTSHDGSFDDFIDSADCFSLKFPYSLWVNGVQHNMNSAEDFSEIPPGAQVQPEFPVTVSMCNYSEVEIPNMNVMNDYIVGCHSGEFYDDVITCVDFQYPIDLSLFDSGTSDFETIRLEHDWDVYSTIQSLNPSTLVTIQYPVRLILSNGDLVTVNSNIELKSQILRIIAICN